MTEKSLVKELRALFDDIASDVDSAIEEKDYGYQTLAGLRQKIAENKEDVERLLGEVAKTFPKWEDLATRLDYQKWFEETFKGLEAFSAENPSGKTEESK